MATDKQRAQAALNRVGGQSANDRKTRQLRFRKNAKKYREEEMSAVRRDTAMDVGKDLATEAAIAAATAGVGLVGRAAIKGATKGYKSYKVGKKVQEGAARGTAAKIALARAKKREQAKAKKRAAVEAKAVAEDRAKRKTAEAAAPRSRPKAPKPTPKKPATKSKPKAPKLGDQSPERITSWFDRHGLREPADPNAARALYNNRTVWLKGTSL